MSYSSNELNLIGGSSSHSNGVAGSAATSTGTNVCLVNRSVLKELNSNESNSMLGSKTALNNSKLLTSSVSNTQLNSSKISATAAGSASSTVFENSSSPHKLHIDQQLEAGVAFDDHKQQQQESHYKHASKDLLNNSGVNKSSNKFVGLTEFDEAKIPELPGDLNPNIEEQYNVTFEECFIPTLNAQQGTRAPDEYFKVDKSHLLLPTEADVTSSDNETFADCDDEKDPLDATYAESASLDLTESFQSFNKSLNSTFSNTMENIADTNMEAMSQPLQNIKLTQMVEQLQNGHIQAQVEIMDEYEPMDIDMNETLENIHHTSNNIQYVEKVLQHAENILQHLDDKNAGTNTENVEGLLEKQTDSPKEPLVATAQLESAVNKSHPLEIQQSRHALSLSKSIELLINKAKTPSTECIIEKLNKEMGQEDDDAQNQLKNEPDNLNSIYNDDSNSSTNSNSSAKSLVNSKTETKLNSNASLNTSMKSQKSSAPSSTSFPLRNSQSSGFPRSPKAVAEKLGKSPFLEKSDYLTNNESQAVEVKLTNNIIEEQFTPNLMINEFNGNSVEPALPVEEDKKRRTFLVDISMAKNKEQQKENNTLNEDKMIDENRLIFAVKENKNASTLLTHFPSMDKIENNRRTFSVIENEHLSTETISAIDKSDVNPRHSFNLPSEEFIAKSTEHTDLNISLERMEVDDHASEQISMPLPSDEEQISHSASLQNSQSPPLQNMQQISQSPSLPVIDQKSLSPPLASMQQRSESLFTAMAANLQSSLPISESSSLPTERPKTQSPPLQTTQPTSKSPPLSNMQSRSQSPSVPTMPSRSQSPVPIQSSSLLPQATPNASETQPTPPESTVYESVKIKEEPISPTSFESFASQPLSTLIQKRPSIRDARARAADMLSAKEQSNIKVRDEKDVVVEKNTPSPSEEVFSAVSATSTTLTNSSEFWDFDQTSSSCSSMINNGEQQIFSGNNLVLNPSDFDYLLTKGNNNIPVGRSSLLLKFDPLLGVPVQPNQGQQHLQQFEIPTNTINTYLSPTLEEEDEHNDSNCLFVIDTKSEASAKPSNKERSQEVEEQSQLQQQVQQNKRQLTQGAKKKNATMSVDVIKDMSLDKDCNKTFENSNSTQSDDKQINYKMDELEKKIKNEVLKTEDIEKKLKDAEQREEALIKRITEKDKTITKMTGVIEAYEKAIAELIADKEQLTQNYEKQLAEAKADRDSNYHHLTSLETTFSDLHVKYEKSKEMTCQLKESEEALQAEKRRNLENLHLQEQRYDKMKNHAMQQLEIANRKLESLTREHSIEITKLKALLKKEEIARSSINEQLAQKTKENAELVKICDELISDQGIS